MVTIIGAKPTVSELEQNTGEDNDASAGAGNATETEAADAVPQPSPPRDEKSKAMDFEPLHKIPSLSHRELIIYVTQKIIPKLTHNELLQITAQFMCAKEMRQHMKESSILEEETLVEEEPHFNTKIVTKYRRWDQRYQELVNFKNKHGHMNLTKKTMLGRWMGSQRTSQNMGRLSEERYQKLNDIGFEWGDSTNHFPDDFNGKTSDEKWEFRFNQLKEFKEKNGNCKVPVNWPEDSAFSSWAGRQRTLRRKKKLPEERYNRLEELGFDWGEDIPDASSKGYWEYRYKQLLQFHKEHGHVQVPVRYKENPLLGSWVSTQRTKNRQNTLSKERFEKLDALGFFWNTISTNMPANAGVRDVWDIRYKQLLEYKQEHGNCEVPTNYPKCPPLGPWVKRQKYTYRKKTIKKDRFEQLDKLGINWKKDKPEKSAMISASMEVWDFYYKALEKYKEEKGNCDVPFKYPINPPLGPWVHRTRDMYKKKKLSEDRVQKLDKLDFGAGVSEGVIVLRNHQSTTM